MSCWSGSGGAQALSSVQKALDTFWGSKPAPELHDFAKHFFLRKIYQDTMFSSQLHKPVLSAYDVHEHWTYVS